MALVSHKSTTGIADPPSFEELREALRGRVTKHHRFLLRLHLNQMDALDAAMATLDAQVEANLGPFRAAVELIGSIPGIKNLGARVIPRYRREFVAWPEQVSFFLARVQRAVHTHADNHVNRVRMPCESAAFRTLRSLSSVVR
jgi:transposase